MAESLRQLIDTYTSGPLQLRRYVAGMTRDQLLARPVAGKWSTLEVVAHISDFEPILADRIKRTLALELPSLLAADENCFVNSLAYQERDLEEELRLIELTRSQLARILAHQPESVLERQGIHSIKGPKTVAELLKMVNGHIAGHLPHINDKRRALGLLEIPSA
jgi:hypothetical protein